jgi:hypothetical protein
MALAMLPFIGGAIGLIFGGWAGAGMGVLIGLVIANFFTD